MNAAVERYVPLVEFLGAALGSNTEIALHDFTDLEHSIVAIANGHVSNRKIGAPATDFALKIVNDYAPERGDIVSGYTSHSTDNRPLRSASYIIRDGGRTVGMLCINVDLSKFEQLERLSRDLLASYTPAVATREDHANATERLTPSTDDLVQATVTAHASELGKPIERLTQDERIEIVRKLNDNGVYLLKGAVAQTAQAMGISEPSVYRYLQKVRRAS